MGSSSLSRYGAWLVAGGLAGLWGGPSLAAAIAGAEAPLVLGGLRFATAIGLLLLVVGLAGRLLQRAAKRCPRCGRRPARDSVFCTEHRRELAHAAQRAHARHSRDDRNW